MDLELIVTLAMIAAFLAFTALERILPGYDYPERPLWVLRGFGWFVVAFMVGSVVPMWTDDWLRQHALVNLSSLGLWGVLPAILAYQLLGYAWHRMLHALPFLWRIHQWHHASERIDMGSALRFHPLDIAGWTVVGSVSSLFLLGVSLEAALVHAFLASAMAWFGHTNIRTPRWLGYVIARPENHALHHGRGLHRKNYADLPVIDILFRTFQNPDRAPEQAGFWDGASECTTALLLGRDVSQPPAREVSHGERAVSI